MVHFNVQLKIIQQIKLAKEADHGLTVIVVLVLAGFTRLWLNEESTFKALFSCIVFCSVQKAGEVFFLALHIGIEQAHITLTATPEYIVLAVECNRRIQRCFYLGTTMGQNLKIRI